MVEEKIWWKTGKRVYYATFAQFAAANQLDYDLMKEAQTMDIVLENPLPETDYPIYYEPTNVGIPRVFGGTQGLRHHPAVINKIARVTLMPKSGNKEKVRGLYWNVISHVMNGNRINVIALIMDQLAYLRLNLEMNLYLHHILCLSSRPRQVLEGFVSAITLLLGHSRMTRHFFLGP